MVLEHPVERVAEGKDEADECRDANQLGYELASIAIEQARYRAGYAIP